MLNRPGILLRVEGAAVFGISLYSYRWTGASWWLFLLLFLWPDLFMVGYLANVRLGANLYNLAHTYIFALALVGVAAYQHKPVWLAFALIWIAHIGIDRALGFGLKYPTSFRDTHLQRVNKAVESRA